MLKRSGLYAFDPAEMTDGEIVDELNQIHRLKYVLIGRALNIDSAAVARLENGKGDATNSQMAALAALLAFARAYQDHPVNGRRLVDAVRDPLPGISGSSVLLALQNNDLARVAALTAYVREGLLPPV